MEEIDKCVLFRIRTCTLRIEYKVAKQLLKSSHLKKNEPSVIIIPMGTIYHLAYIPSF